MNDIAVTEFKELIGKQFIAVENINTVTIPKKLTFGKSVVMLY